MIMNNSWKINFSERPPVIFERAEDKKVISQSLEKKSPCRPVNNFLNHHPTHTNIGNIKRHVNKLYSGCSIPKPTKLKPKTIKNI